MEKEKNLASLKAEYSELQARFGLPDFDDLNRDFSVDKIDESETDYLIRDIRMPISEKITNYLKLIEIILNPASATIFIFSMVKCLSKEDKQKLSEIYNVLSKKELEMIKLDLNFSEEKEADFVKDAFETWQKVKKELFEIIASIENKWDNKSELNDKGYFG